jgi:hypothetical protein
MPLIDENDVSQDLKYFKVHGVPDEFNKLIIYDNDVYLPLEAFNLTNANIISYMIETNSGNALVTKTGKVYLSGQTALSMAYVAHPDKVDELEECLGRLFEKAVESEIIQNPVNEILL